MALEHMALIVKIKLGALRASFSGFSKCGCGVLTFAAMKGGCAMRPI